MWEKVEELQRENAVAVCVDADVDVDVDFDEQAPSRVSKSVSHRAKVGKAGVIATPVENVSTLVDMRKQLNLTGALARARRSWSELPSPPSPIQ